jgi:hypothetical protein
MANLKAAFLFVADGAESAKHRSWVKTPEVEILCLAINNYSEIESIVEELITKEQCQAIELCGGFGHQAVGRVSKAAAGRALVGVVRFDTHPGLGNKSGDTMY